MGKKIHIITPVKDSIETTLRTIESICESEFSVEYSYTVFNDFSNNESTQALQQITQKHNVELVNLDQLTTLESPNYRLVLQIAQKKAIKENAHLVIVESDVIVKKDTIQKMVDLADELKNPAFVAAITVDENNSVNFPYLYAKLFQAEIMSTKRRLSFCCTLLTNSFLTSYNFDLLNPSKSWFDIFLSHKAVKLGFNNYLATSLRVFHNPHSSRPWKKLKYENPIKYYFLKIFYRQYKK